MQPRHVDPVTDASLLGSAIVEPLSKLIQGQAAIVRVACGSVKPLGLGALLRAVQECGRANTAHGAFAHSGPQGIDLWNADVAQPGSFLHLTKALGDGGLNRLRLIRLCELGLSDNHVIDLACALSQHPHLEILSITNNHFSARAGIQLFDTFVSLQHARALDMSLNPLGDVMVEAMAERLSSGSPWNLQALWFAYCSVSRRGLKDMARIIRAGANNLEHIVLSGQKDTTEEWETLTESCLETAVKLRILPELMDASQMSVHVMDEMSQAAVNGKRNNDTLSAAFMSYYHKFMEQKKVYGDCYIDDIKANQRVDSTECSVLDNAWSSAMEIMDAIRF